MCDNRVRPAAGFCTSKMFARQLRYPFETAIVCDNRVRPAAPWSSFVCCLSGIPDSPVGRGICALCGPDGTPRSFVRVVQPIRDICINLCVRCHLNRQPAVLGQCCRMRRHTVGFLDAFLAPEFCPLQFPASSLAIEPVISFCN